MKIVQQVSKEECGVCCLTMLVNHYVSNKINKFDILENVNLKNNGLSIIDLESCASKYNIYLDSYHCKWYEIFDEKPKKPFLMIYKYDEFLHYVVAEYNNQKIKVYDPIGDVIEYDKNTRPQYFNDICIFTNHCEKELSLDIKENKTIRTWSVKYLILMVFLSLFLFSINLLVTHICSFIMSIKELNFLLITKLIIFFILVLITKYLTDLLFNKISNWYFKKTYFVILNKFKKLFIYKDSNFYSTIEQTNILFFYQIIKEYINYTNSFFINLIKNTIFICILFVFMIQFKWIFLLIVVINILNFVSEIFITNMNTKYDKYSLEKTNEVNKIILQFCEFNKQNINVEKRYDDLSEILKKIKSFESKSIKYDWKLFKINSWFSSFNQLLNVITFLVIFVTYNQNFTSSLVLCISLMNLWNGIVSELCSLLTSRKSFKLLKDIFNRFISLNNLNINQKTINLEKVEKINIDDNDISNGTILNTVNFDINSFFEYEKLLINNIKCSEINKEDLWNKVIYSNLQNNFNICDVYNSFIKKLDSDLKTEFLNFVQLINNNANNINVFNSMIFNLFELTSHKNKIIIISSKLELNDSSFFKMMSDKLMNNIMKNNFVLFENTYQFKHLSNQVFEKEY